MGVQFDSNYTMVHFFTYFRFAVDDWYVAEQKMAHLAHRTCQVNSFLGLNLCNCNSHWTFSLSLEQTNTH